MDTDSADFVLRAGGTAVVLHASAGLVPEILYWGRDLGGVDVSDILSWGNARAGVVSGTPDTPPRLPIIPMPSDGWSGTPGLVGHRHGTDQFSAFRLHGYRATSSSAEFDCVDDEAHLALHIFTEVTSSGLFRCRAVLTNEGEETYSLLSLLCALPVPAHEGDVVDQSGHHLREKATSFHEFTIGCHERVTRVGRGHSASSIHGTCEHGTQWNRGSVHYLHVAWSGNTRSIAERTAMGARVLMGGEFLYPGEVEIEPGGSYVSPWIYATWGEGLNDAAQRFHAYMREHVPTVRQERPVTFNAWEAVYFDHDQATLERLVVEAASVGAERFVLDDGWFGGRRNDTAGLGDWHVSADIWPEGLAPLADLVHSHGMEFGLWCEPEMLNANSELARSHPEWMCAPRTHLPVPERSQYVLDLTQEAAYTHIREQLCAVLRDSQVDAIKWDFNRDMLEAQSPSTGLPIYHAQVGAVYRLMDEIRERFPSIEIESCAGGGGRVDLAMLEHACRVWGSDTTDPLERAGIEEGTSLLLPPHLVGSHISSPAIHTTGRVLPLRTRACLAILSHCGVEWDLTTATATELNELRRWIALHKQLRPLIRIGRLVHADVPDSTWKIRGIVAPDQTRAVYVFLRMETSEERPYPEIRLPGLASARHYYVSELLPEHLASEVRVGGRYAGSWRWFSEGITLPGAVLGEVGVRYPEIDPGRAFLLSVSSTDARSHQFPQLSTHPPQK